MHRRDEPSRWPGSPRDEAGCHNQQAQSSRPSGPAGPRSRRSTCSRPATRPATTVRGVHHLALICRDVEETIRFYQELLGFPLVELVENRDYAGSSHFFFDIGNRNLLGFFDFPGHDHPDFSETIGAVQHLALSTSDEEFAAARARLDEAGIEYLGPGPGRREQPLHPRPERRRASSSTPSELGRFEGEPLLS